MNSTPKTFSQKNTCNTDREGQRLIDEVINFCNASTSKISATQRCLISDLNPTAIKKSLANLRRNSDFIPLATSALTRARADWLYGMNMTRLCTVQGQKPGMIKKSKRTTRLSQLHHKTKRGDRRRLENSAT